MLAEMAGHQAFDGLVGVKKTIGAQQEGQARGDCGNRDGEVRQQGPHAWQYYGREWITID